MPNILRDLHVSFQDADFDDDLVSLGKSLIDIMRWCHGEAKSAGFELSPTEVPERFHKMQPHFPAMKYRKAARPALAEACKIEDPELRVHNVHVVALAICYIYHLPVDVLRTLAETEEDTPREKVKQVLLDDDMSPNWLKDPSGRDFSALHL
jgi:hypothetical protein